MCDSHTDPDMGMITGQCRCKANVKGMRCDDCKEGYFGLSQNDLLGCQRTYVYLPVKYLKPLIFHLRPPHQSFCACVSSSACNCDPRGIIVMEAPCDQISGDCSCKRYVTGRYCNQCLVSDDCSSLKKNAINTIFSVSVLIVSFISIPAA